MGKLNTAVTWNADHLQHSACFLNRFLLPAFFVKTDHFSNLVFNGFGGVQARHRILEDHRHNIAADRFHLLL